MCEFLAILYCTNVCSIRRIKLVDNSPPEITQLCLSQESPTWCPCRQICLVFQGCSLWLYLWSHFFNQTQTFLPERWFHNTEAQWHRDFTANVLPQCKCWTSPPTIVSWKIHWSISHNWWWCETWYCCRRLLGQPARASLFWHPYLQSLCFLKQSTYSSIIQETRKSKEMSLQSTGSWGWTWFIHPFSAIGNWWYGYCSKHLLQTDCSKTLWEIKYPLCNDHGLAYNKHFSHSCVRLFSSSTVHVLEIVDLKPRSVLEVLLMQSW